MFIVSSKIIKLNLSTANTLQAFEFLSQPNLLTSWKESSGKSCGRFRRRSCWWISTSMSRVSTIRRNWDPASISLQANMVREIWKEGWIGFWVVRIGEYDICSWSNDYYTNLNLWVLRIKLQVCSYNRRLKHLVLQQYSREVIWSLNPRKDFTWFCGTSNSFRMGLIKVKYDDLCSTKAGHSRKKWDKDSSTFISQHLQILLALGFL